MAEDREFELRIEHLHSCFLGRKPENKADIQQAENGESLAVITAFCEFQNRGLYPEPWILNALGKSFNKYLQENADGETHKDYTKLDSCMNLSRKHFRTVGREKDDYDLAKQFYLYKWCFGIGHREVMTALQKNGCKFEIKGKEALEPEHIYERTDYARLYDNFVKEVESRGYNKEETAQKLLADMKEEARRYMMLQIKRRNKTLYSYLTTSIPKTTPE